MTSVVSNFSCFLEKEDKDKIDGVVTDEEIRLGLWALKPFKALGPDRLHASFYQHFWPDVKNSICMEIRQIFARGVVPSYLNEPLISLIPKCQNPESLSNYRPINLCNSIYKIVSKIIVGHIRPHLSKLISPVQMAFIPSHRGTDNVLIAQELFYALDRKKGKIGYMVVKLDLEKAYDCLEWSIIHRVLQAFHFPLKLSRIIMGWVTSSNTKHFHFG